MIFFNLFLVSSFFFFCFLSIFHDDNLLTTGWWVSHQIELYFGIAVQHFIRTEVVGALNGKDVFSCSCSVEVKKGDFCFFYSDFIKKKDFKLW